MGFPHLADVQLLWPPLHCLHLCWKGRFFYQSFVLVGRGQLTYMSLFDSGWREDRSTYFVLSREFRFQSSG